MATSKIRSFVKKVKKEVSSSSSTFGLRANRRRKSQSLAEIVSREPLGSCTEPAQSSQHAAQLSDAYDDAPLDQPGSEKVRQESWETGVEPAQSSQHVAQLPEADDDGTTPDQSISGEDRQDGSETGSFRSRRSSRPISQNGSDIPELTQEEIETMVDKMIRLREEAAERAAAARAEPGYAERRLRWEKAMGWHRQR